MPGHSLSRSLALVTFVSLGSAISGHAQAAPAAPAAAPLLGKVPTEAMASTFANREHWMQKVVLLLALGKSWHPVGTPMIVQALRDKDPRLVAFGVEELLRTDAALLPKIATTELLDELIVRQLARNNEHLRTRVLLALERLAPTAGAKDKAAWATWWNGAKATFAPEPWPDAEKGNAEGTTTSATAQRAFDLYQTGLDLAICIDSTGSMQPTIDALAEALDEMVDILDGISPKLRLAIVQYKDYGDLGKAGAKVVQPFTKNIRAARKNLGDLRADGGGDLPEAVLGGLTVTLDSKMNWQMDANKLVVVIGDAPPHPQETQPTIDLVRTVRESPGAMPGKPVTGQTQKTKPSPFLTSCIGVFLDLKGKLREQQGYREFMDSQQRMREEFTKIAAAGGGTFVDVTFTFSDEQPKEKPKDKDKAKEQQRDAGRSIAAAATRKIVEHILVLSFGEQHKEAMREFVRIFFEYKDAELIK